MVTHAVLVLDEPDIWGSLPLELPYLYDGPFPILLSPPENITVFNILMGTDIFSHCLHRFQPARLTGGFLESEGFVVYFYAGGDRVRKVGYIVWRKKSFVVDHLGFKTLCFCQYLIGGICGQK